MTPEPRAGRRGWLIVAGVLLVVGYGPMAVTMCGPDEKRLDAFGYVVRLHAGGRLDVYRGAVRLVRWHDFTQVTVAWALLATIVWSLLRLAARASQPPVDSRRGFPLD